ncbi:hypothetical protein NMY22_g12634 [Coprinellus aureogranulatus]|nr:hypothetical protein NMY22_g12634 [Coprinellus aureogranulatus]
MASQPLSPLPSFIELCSRVIKQQSLYRDINFDTAIDFFNLSCLLKPFISLHLSAFSDGPPERLPVRHHDFLKRVLRLREDSTKALWSIVQDLVWKEECGKELRTQLGHRYIPYFLNNPTADIGDVHPHRYVRIDPTNTITCINPACVSESGVPKELVEALSLNVSIFSQDFGAIPGISVSMYCRGCKTRYYHNYYVHDKATRHTYYREQPQFIHGSESSFMDRRTYQMFTSMMLHAWTSATNCARVYNESIVRKEFRRLLPEIHAKSLVLDVETLWNSLFLFWLIEDAADGEEVLEIPHDRDHSLRLDDALNERNLRMAGTGQEEWSHACDLCCWIKNDGVHEPEVIRSHVVDGVTLGQPCCSVHDCPLPLLSNRDRFCPEHWALDDQCCVESCKADSEPGHRTCSLPEHRTLESHLREENKAMFNLKRRLARLGAKTPQVENPNTILDEQDDDEVQIDQSGVCEGGKPDTGNKGLKARFGRRRTHNEELCVASCGVIVGRATFFGSEAPNGVRTFLMGLFPTKRSLPRVIWHDNNCKILAMLRNDTDPYLRHYFDDSLMVVDVFHFKSKHKESDKECNANCNPAMHKDLVTSDGRWRFNSSAAEQANAWIGGYQAMVREMRAIRYDFFLDEMIRRRNCLIVRELERNEKTPFNVPRSALLD